VSANERQVGGDHYKSELQHWDFVEDFEVPYLEAQVLRYVTRAYRKNGVEDLEKAVHTVEKLMDRVVNFRRQPYVYIPDVYIKVYCSENHLDDEQRGIITKLLQWRDMTYLVVVHSAIKQMIKRLLCER
jgi:hypothetical protein